jgi:hypothetical protein
MDEVFKALADPTRRSLLDELFREDGQTLSALEERFSMTRFGVMKHLQGARGGRPGRHPPARPREAPLPEPGPDPARPRPVGEQVRRALGRLRSATSRADWRTHGKGVRDLHQDHPGAALAGDHRPEIRSKYNFGARQTTDWTPGSRYEMGAPGAPTPLGEGVNLEVDPPRRLVQTMVALWGDDVKAREPRGSPGRSSPSATRAG